MNWEQIYSEYLPMMMEVAARRSRGRPDVDAADLVHEAFALAMCDAPMGVRHWYDFLARLMTQVCSDHTEQDIPSAEEIDQLEDPEDVAVRRLGANEVRQRVLAVMSYMTERQCEITRLRLFDGLSVGEIATIVNTSSSNVSQIVIRCLTKLGPILAQLDTFDGHDLECLRPPRRMR